MMDTRMGSRFMTRTLIAAALCAAPAWAQLTSTDIEALQMDAQEQGWTFQVGANPATYRDLNVIATLEEPNDWQATGQVNPLMTAPSGSVTLPEAWDWREQNGCTPVRNQASCGSCWAFATVGALESAIMIDSGVSQDLSEQYLVSCNYNNYSCSGGWFAHAYHYKTAGRSGGVGAVLEAAKPYKASNTACGGPFSHPYVIKGWYFVDTSYAVPSVDAIKQAIYTYGPVSAAVHVGSAFQAYTSGVFNACEAGAINHAIVLVGWSDTDQAWILRNSWGPYWGESGYMRIAYNCSQVGYGACYVDYGSGESPAARMTSPTSGSTFGSRSATFEWGSVADATEYWLAIGSASNKMNLYSASQGTATSVTVDGLPSNGSTLYVKLFTKIDGKWYGQLYTYKSATLASTAATMTSPTPGSALESSTATFAWNMGVGATEYQLWIGTTAGGYNLYNRSQGKNLSVTVSNLPVGGRTLYVRLFSKIAGAWQRKDYTYTAAAVTPEAATLTSPEPSSTLESSTVTFAWSEGLGVSEYLLQIGTTLGAQNVYKKSQGKNRSLKLAGLPTNGGTLYVRMYSKIASGWQYNDYQYTTPNLSRSAAEMTSPAGGSTLESNVVTFSWSEGVGATQYKLDVSTSPGTGNLYNQTLGLNRSVTLKNMPLNGKPVYVRLWSMIGGAWQKRNYTYTAVTATAAPAEITSPEAGSTLTSSMVKFEWTAGVGVREYWLRVGTTFGGTELYNKSAGLNQSVTVSNLPVNSRKLYVRLLSNIGGTYQKRDYTYTSAGSGSAQLIPEE